MCLGQAAAVFFLLLFFRLSYAALYDVFGFGVFAFETLPLNYHRQIIMEKWQ